jgi:hypothetical protein
MTDRELERAREAATIIAGWPRVLATLLAEHVAGPDGRCRGCVAGVTGAPRSPCRIADLAASALEISRGRRS